MGTWISWEPYPSPNLSAGELFSSRVLKSVLRLLIQEPYPQHVHAFETLTWRGAELANILNRLLGQPSHGPTCNDLLSPSPLSLQARSGRAYQAEVRVVGRKAQPIELVPAQLLQCAHRSSAVKLGEIRSNVSRVSRPVLYEGSYTDYEAGTLYKPCMLSTHTTNPYIDPCVRSILLPRFPAEAVATGVFFWPPESERLGSRCTHAELNYYGADEQFGSSKR